MRKALRHITGLLARRSDGSRAGGFKLEGSISRPDANGPGVLLMPSNADTGGSSHLRGYAIAQELARRSWRVSIAPPSWSIDQRRELLNVQRPDVILMQKARHELNRPGLYPDCPVVFDLDDADYHIADQADAVTEACRDSRSVIAGSEGVAAWCRRHNDDVTVVWTGAPVHTLSMGKPSADRQPVVAASTTSVSRYAAELNLAVDIIEQVARQRPVEFRLFGVRKPRRVKPLLDRLKSAGVPTKTYPPMGYEKFLHHLTGAAVGLAIIDANRPFNEGKSFGKVLAYLASGVAVVASNCCEHPLFFRHGHNGMLADGLDDWVGSVCELLDQPQRRQRMVEAARQDFSNRLSTQVATTGVASVLCRAAGIEA